MGIFIDYHTYLTNLGLSPKNIRYLTMCDGGAMNPLQ